MKIDDKEDEKILQKHKYSTILNKRISQSWSCEITGIKEAKGWEAASQFL